MAEFEGDILELAPVQQKFIIDVLEKQGFTGKTIHVESVGKAGDNYIGVVKRITVHGDADNTFKMIAKVAPTHELMRQNYGTACCFSNEIIMYNEVLPKFTEYQKAAGVPIEERLRYAQCYGTLSDPPYELILLEDLQTSNFEMLDRFQPLTDESVRLILKNFAILHSLSFVMNTEEPDTFERCRRSLVDYFHAKCSVPEFNLFLTNLENDCLKVLDSDRYRKAVRGSLSQMALMSKKIFQHQSISRFSVILQGDTWTNNIMFRLENKQPVEAIMIDYQISKVSSPAIDLLYMILNCTDHGTRRKHFDEWIAYYHSEMDKSLSNYGIRINYAYPRDQLDADLRRCSKLLFAFSLLLSTVLIRSSEDAAKIKEAMEGDLDINDVEALNASNLDSNSVLLFKRRIEGLVDSYREFGYLE